MSEAKELKEVLTPITDKFKDMATTYCLLLCHEVCGAHSEHFQRTDAWFTPDGILASYDCTIDGKVYTVKISQKGL